MSFFVVSPIINDITLNNFAEQLNEYPLPESTSLIEKEAVCGKLNGNGNGMDFFACILIKSDLSIDELMQYYDQEELRAAKKGSKYSINLDIIHANGDKLETGYLEHQKIYFSTLNNVTDYTGYYIVMIYDGGYPAYFDMRGN
ncbi:hypothetical protein [Vallitalea okinawensis]|uniref:hypothetical protein n=1 Tax=Vallitalea okinawensis TaxID=2078660 RepID=UPI001300A40F|nr:hypothetical protein [Vallitalea okinawensis]